MREKEREFCATGVSQATEGSLYLRNLAAKGDKISYMFLSRPFDPINEVSCTALHFLNLGVNGLTGMFAFVSNCIFRTPVRYRF